MNKPCYHQQKEFLSRLEKSSQLRQLGINPYPHHFEQTVESSDLQKKYAKKDAEQSEQAFAETTEHVSVAGRLVLFRAMGKNAFGHIQDSQGRLQIMFNRDFTCLSGYKPNLDNNNQKPIKIIEKKCDLGDFIGVEGFVFRTKKGELTILAKIVTVLAKSLLPLPDKHSGLSDQEVCYRKRWLQLIAEKKVYHIFQQRSQILHLIRHYFHEHQFMEVETPVLQPIYGGAQARPFRTTCHSLSNQSMFLRISLEISLKKLLVGGFSKIFEIGKVFRNEGIDRSHNPEFTMLEAYASYWDYRDMRSFVENLFLSIAQQLLGTEKIDIFHEGNKITIDLSLPWKTLTMKESILEYGNLNIDGHSDEKLQLILRKEYAYSITELKRLSRGKLIQAIFEKKVEKHLIVPHHIIDHPIETTPLCKPHRNAQKRQEGLVERFESFIASYEICNAYSELNDPQLQRQLLLEQSREHAAGDAEASPLDEDFIEAICQGMPPAGGIGIGIDRLMMIFTGVNSIRDVLYFPFMKSMKTTTEGARDAKSHN